MDQAAPPTWQERARSTGTQYAELLRLIDLLRERGAYDVGRVVPDPFVHSATVVDWILECALMARPAAALVGESALFKPSLIYQDAFAEALADRQRQLGAPSQAWPADLVSLRRAAGHWIRLSRPVVAGSFDERGQELVADIADATTASQVLDIVTAPYRPWHAPEGAVHPHVAEVLQVLGEQRHRAGISADELDRQMQLQRGRPTRSADREGWDDLRLAWRQADALGLVLGVHVGHRQLRPEQGQRSPERLAEVLETAGVSVAGLRRVAAREELLSASLLAQARAYVVVTAFGNGSTISELAAWAGAAAPALRAVLADPAPSTAWTPGTGSMTALRTAAHLAGVSLTFSLALPAPAGAPPRYLVRPEAHLSVGLTARARELFGRARRTGVDGSDRGRRG